MPKGFRFEHCSAVITGASSGLGAEFARQLAPQARAMLLVARRGEVLEQQKAELLALRPALIVHTCAADITTAEGRAKVVDSVASTGLSPNLLINNAGMGDYGSFLSADESRLSAQVDLNITALLMLTHALVPKLVASAEVPAGVLNVSSLAGTVPIPAMAVYAASKAFVTVFTEGLRVELEDQYVIVSALCPGPTATSFSKTAKRADGTDTDRSGQDFLRMPPAEVVRAGLNALAQNQATVYPGIGVAVSATLFRLLPRPLLRLLIAKRYRAARARQSAGTVKP